MIRCLSICVTNYELFITFLSNWPILFIVDIVFHLRMLAQVLTYHTHQRACIKQVACVCLLDELLEKTDWDGRMYY